MKPLTKRQREALDRIEIYIEDNGHSPTLEEISGMLSVTIPTSQYYVEELVVKGYLGKYRGKIYVKEKQNVRYD